jgi:membrane dipeptidase
LHRFGIRIIQPTYNLRNLLGDGCLESDNAGLSKIGNDAVVQMNELGILIDLSHCGLKTTMDAIQASKKPVAFTHTGCAAVHNHPRNKTDEQLRALADRGGVVGIYFMPYLRNSGQQTVQDVMLHLNHAIKIAGEDHVGIGTDGSISPLKFTPEYLKAHQQDIEARRKAGIGAPGEQEDVHLYVPELNSPTRFETLSEILAKHGYTQTTIEKIIGENFTRLFQKVWQSEPSLK